MTAPPAPLFDARLARLHRARAAGRFDTRAFLHKNAADDLAERLEAIPRRFNRALLLGAPGLMRGAIAARPALAARIGETIAADSVAPLAPGGVALAPDALPFAVGHFDLVLSPLFLHWANDLPGALIQVRAGLTGDGLMLASVFGGDTLSELRTALLEGEAEARGGAGLRVAPFADVRALGALLQRAGFALPAADRDVITARYRDPFGLLRDLRGMGETNALATRAGPLTRSAAIKAGAAYARRFSDPDGRVRATFEIVTLTGWAPHASQQTPLRPGSAQARLADALGVEERDAGEKTGKVV
ncbi:MAG: SAM-dependent methyltransferase [Alphaproteobacteria bacterium]|nr:SAM-dependent methyltransferase [Alphaproteobacteria bacterium]